MGIWKLTFMSGHSKWSQIKHQKASEDAKRGQLFSKIAQEIGAAAKQNPDRAGNPTLSALIEKARAANMPKENIERAIERASIKEQAAGEEFVIEAYGAEGQGLIIKGSTDNKNRTLGELRTILNKYSAKIVAPGGVSWNFDGQTPRMTKPSSPSFVTLIKEIEKNPDVSSVLTDAV